MAYQVDQDVDHLSWQVVKIAQECLQRSDHRDLRTISCHFDDGVLYLRGHLPSFYYKQLAQEAVRDVIGVRQAVNEIEVSPM